MIVVFASGSGSNFEALVCGLPGQSFHLVCNVPNAGVLKRAERLNVSHSLIDHSSFACRKSHERAIYDHVKDIPCHLIVLAGYMRVLSPHFFKLFSNTTIVNLHPASPNLYKGANGYAAAVRSKYPFWQISVHHVIPELDSGLVIGSITFDVFPYETPEQLSARVQTLEHTLLLQTVTKLIGDDHAAV